MFSIFFSILASLGMLAAPAMDSLPQPVNACAPILMQEGVSYSSLLDAGYVGNPTDGMEALYAPGC